MAINAVTNLLAEVKASSPVDSCANDLQNIIRTSLFSLDYSSRIIVGQVITEISKRDFDISKLVLALLHQEFLSSNTPFFDDVWSGLTALPQSDRHLQLTKMRDGAQIFDLDEYVRREKRAVVETKEMVQKGKLEARDIYRFDFDNIPSYPDYLERLADLEAVYEFPLFVKAFDEFLPRYLRRYKLTPFGFIERANDAVCRHRVHFPFVNKKMCNQINEVIYKDLPEKQRLLGYLAFFKGKNVAFKTLELNMQRISGIASYMPDIERVVLDFVLFEEGSLRPFISLKNFRTLEMSFAKFAEDITLLGELRLECLKVKNSSLTDKFLPVLERMKTLKVLELDCSDLTDALGDVLHKLPHLERLYLEEGNNFTNTFFVSLEKLKNLKTLQLKRKQGFTPGERRDFHFI